MTRQIRIPGLVDLRRIKEPGAIRNLAKDSRLDREFAPVGPVLNRLIVRRIRDTLQLDGKPLPTIAPRKAPGRAEAQAQLEAEMSKRLEASAPCAQDHLDALADHALGRRPAEELGPVVQEVLGRLFADKYRATSETWEAARLLDQAVRSFNPIRRLVWRITGRVERARRLLAEGVGGDRAALHTTGIAVHNIVSALERMRDLAAHPRAFERIDAAQAVSRCLVAPETVLRQAAGMGTTTEASFQPGTLVTFSLEEAWSRSLSSDIAFMTDGWSRCPAHAWVPALLAATWDRAGQRRSMEGGRP
ncbi:hypothetical protein GGE65_008314 [Skermanella aerolata]|uniref:hypothetical protein n=1 Tax=Skermanella aerolata TaxID=393310 RepID=UPI003D205727